MAVRGEGLPGGFAVAGWGLRVGGAAMAVLGSIHLGDALTPQPVPKPGAGLVGHGLYRFVRHPIYAGLLAYGIGSVLVNPHPATLAAGAGLLVLPQSVKARWEESMLIDRGARLPALRATRRAVRARRRPTPRLTSVAVGEFGFDDPDHSIPSGVCVDG